MDSISLTEWTATTIGNIIDIYDSKRIPLSGNVRKQRQGQYPYYGASGIIDYIDDYIFDGRYLLIAEDGENLNSRKLPVAFFAQGKFWVNNHAHIVRAKAGIADDHFLFSWFGQANISGYITGAAQPKLSQENLKRIELRLPPLPTQRKITAVLSAYDDLIENNMRRIKILEEMAQNLYREWFVKFRFPGHLHARFVDTPLGRTPEGWEVNALSQAVIVRPSLPMPQKTQIPFVPMGSLSNDSMLISDIEYRSKANGARFQNGDTLFARITPCLENGKTGFVQFLPTDEAIACGSTEFIVLRSKTVCPEYVYLMARSEKFRDNAIKSMSGATGRQRVREECFDQFFLAQPPEEILEHFQESTRPQFKMIDSLNRRNQSLRRTRDLLLPKFISGEVDVSELDIILPEKVEA